MKFGVAEKCMQLVGMVPQVHLLWLYLLWFYLLSEVHAARGHGAAVPQADY